MCGTPNYEATKQFQGKDDDFRVGISYVSENWDEVIFADFTTTDVMQITKEGDYTISYTTALDDGMKMIWLDTNLYSGKQDESRRYRYDDHICGRYTEERVFFF